MRNLKKNYIFTLITIVISIIISSCSNDYFIESASKNTVQPLYLKCSSSIEDGNPRIITLTEYTRKNPCLPNSLAIVSKKSSTYTLYIRGLPTPGTWTVFSGTGITFENGSLTASGTTVTVHFASNFRNGSIQAYGSTLAGERYGPILNFVKK